MTSGFETTPARKYSALLVEMQPWENSRFFLESDSLSDVGPPGFISECWASAQRTRTLFVLIENNSEWWIISRPRLKDP